MNLKQAALHYARDLGWAVFPLKPRSKEPATPHGFKDATKDAAQVERWWTEHPNYNIGIATGEVSGIFVVDLDGPEGVKSWSEAESTFGNAPKTRTVITSGGGQHLYFAWPGAKVPNRTRVLPGVDVRGDGGYVVAPPSIHPSGDEYRMSDDD